MSGDHKQLSPEENARIAAAFFLPGLERAIDVLQGLIHELQGVAAAKKSKAGGARVVATEIHDEAIRRVLAGDKVADIAHDLGVNPASIYIWTKRAREGNEPPKPRSEYWTAERRAAKSRQIQAAWRKRKKAAKAAAS